MVFPANKVVRHHQLGTAPATDMQCYYNNVRHPPISALVKFDYDSTKRRRLERAQEDNFLARRASTDRNQNYNPSRSDES